ncbi:unnamed protein product [Clonostachys rosea]|uniref:NmrA-like domain-containing protein n=1 Tax=Bionectria ochroleuca TaxID=29856 RepID=A0ABY6UZ12_BIOOC|nr:unnamed protein product [Clonostachys rosea]
MSTIKNIVIVGASGSLGSVVFDKLVASGKFNIKVLRRHGSKSTFAPGINVVNVDFQSLESLKEALKGQHAVVSTVGTELLAGQKLIIDAAIAVGVKRFIPSEFGSNCDVPSTRKLPVYAYKVQVQDYIIEKSKTTDITYTFIYNAAFLDWGLDHDFTLRVSNYKPLIIDGGDIIFSTTTLSTVADAVIGVLEHPEETKNRTVFIEDTKITQNKLLSIVKQVAPEKPWEPEYAKLADLAAKGDAKLAQGIFDNDVILGNLYQSIFNPSMGGNFEKTDNKLLGLKGLTDEEVVEVVKKHIK